MVTKKQLNIGFLIFGGMIISSVVGITIPIFVNKDKILSIMWVIDIFRYLGLLAATSLLGRKIQLSGLVVLVVTLGFRYVFAYELANSVGVLPNVYFCLGAFIFWLLWLIWEGRKYSIDSDEWKITISTIVQVLLGTILIILIFKG